MLCASPAQHSPHCLRPRRRTCASAEVNAVGNQRLLAGVWRSFFVKSGGGHVVAVLSAAAGEPPWPHMSSYVVGKRALLALLECAVQELARGGLRVSALRPGYVDTPMLAALNPHVLEAVKAKLDGKPLLKAEDVAAQIMARLGDPPAPGRLDLRDLPNR